MCKSNKPNIDKNIDEDLWETDFTEIREHMARYAKSQMEFDKMPKDYTYRPYTKEELMSFEEYWEDNQEENQTDTLGDINIPNVIDTDIWEIK